MNFIVSADSDVSLCRDKYSSASFRREIHQKNVCRKKALCAHRMFFHVIQPRYILFILNLIAVLTLN